MIFHEVELSHTKEIMDSYEVNLLLRNMLSIEALQKKTMKHSTYHSITTLQI